MKLYQALKLKNKLVGEINVLQQRLAAKNSYVVGNPQHFNLDATRQDWENKKNELIALKTAISDANRPVQAKIYELSEHKASVKFWSSVSSREGKENDRWNNGAVTEYKAHFNELSILQTKTELEAKIEQIQQELDYFNQTTELPSY